jgi:choline dehydrogenase
MQVARNESSLSPAQDRYPLDALADRFECKLVKRVTDMLSYTCSGILQDPDTAEKIFPQHAVTTQPRNQPAIAGRVTARTRAIYIVNPHNPTGTVSEAVPFKAGVEIIYDGKVQRIAAGVEVVLSLGAIHTPKVLMLSGIGNQTELQRLGIPCVQHLPGVGENFQDHVGFGCVWEYPQPLPPRNNMAEATCFWKSDPDLDTPDLQTCQGEVLFCSAETAAQFNPPAGSWTLLAGLVRPKSRGRIRLTGANPRDPVDIEANTLAHPDDMKAAIACVELCREIGNSGPLSPFVKREVMPGNLKGAALENFIRDAASSYWHQTCTAKMGHDAMSVVDGSLKVHGIDNLRIADGSIMPRVTTGNTMAPCVVIGERASEMLKIAHRT